jgi:hypothetical protein
MRDSTGTFGGDKHHFKDIFDVLETVFDRDSGHGVCPAFG